MRNCPNHKGKEKRKIALNSSKAVVEEENLDPIDVLQVIISNLGDDWILDSWCFYQMSPNKN